MSSRSQNAFKNQAKFGTKSSEKSKNKIEEIKKKEEQDKDLLKTRMTRNAKVKQNEKPKTVNKLISPKSSQSGNSSSKSNNSNISNRNNDTMKINKSTANKKNLNTSTSSRISKTQFFPSKELYKNAIKAVQESPKDNAIKAVQESSKDNSIKAVQESSKDRERNKTRTLSPSEVKVLKSDSEHSSLESFVNRPQTATIKKVPDIQGDADDYDDDFDSYESDFEEYVSQNTSETTSEISTSDENEPQITAIEVDEEHKLDSGNFELPEVKYKQVLDNIQESTENINIFVEQNRSNLTSLSDEGFEDGKTERSGQFVNFLDAQRKQNNLKSFAIQQRRGEELASMIKLDGQMYTIFEMESIPYNVFIKKFGNNNTVQSSSQTGEDNISEEIQTIQIDRVNMWTQYPVKLAEIKKSNINLNVYKQEKLGVGSDEVTNWQGINYNEQVLKHFMDNVSDVLLNLIEETWQQKSCKDIEINSNKIPFSEGFISFNTNLPYLQNLSVMYASFSSNTTKLITVHCDSKSSTLCVWRISDPNVPEYYITVHGILTCSILVGIYIYGGLNDGTIAIFNSKELCTDLQDGVTAPTYLTNIEAGHISKIVSLEVVNNNQNHRSDDTCNFQVYSLDEDGYIIIWTVITLQNYNKSNVSLQLNIKLSLKKLYPQLLDLHCTSMAVNQLDVNHIFVSTNYGKILHFVTTAGTKAKPKSYTNDWISQANCIATCPFSPLYMIVAYDNGNIVLFSRNTETPLITLMNCYDFDDTNGVEFVEWSKNKPCILYVKDKRNFIHIWDLSMSDIFPIYTVPFKQQINFIKLSSDISRDENVKRTYMVVITDKCNVNLHILNKDHGQQNPTDYESNVRKFLNYVNRL